MKLTVNVGLNVGATTSLSSHVAREILVANGFTILRHRTVESDTEPTLVAEVIAPRIPGIAIHQTAVDLGQDCIAVVNAAGNGALIGPRAAAWGKFNPAFFFGLDGKRLSQEVAA